MDNLSKVIISKVRYYFILSKYNSFHIHLSFDRGIPSVRVIKQETLLADKEQVFLEKKAVLSMENYIRYVLEHIQGCNYVIFSDRTNVQFIQFWVADDRYELYFPVTPYNHHSAYFNKMIRLLESNGFTYEKKQKGRPNEKCYMKIKEGRCWSVYAQFGNDPIFTADLTISAFTNVFNLTLDNIRVALG